VALASDPALKRLGGLLRSMLLIGLDSVLRDWWLSWLVNVSRLEVSLALMCEPSTGALLLLNREGSVRLTVAMMVVCSSTTVDVLLVLCCLYMYNSVLLCL
jgi:hypothetical protein